ncbi:MAG: hypothetical protein AAGF11_05955 [Myxococcota bacterium]
MAYHPDQRARGAAGSSSTAMIVPPKSNPRCSLHLSAAVGVASLLGLLACGPKNAPPSETPASTAAAPQAEAEAEATPESEAKPESGGEAQPGGEAKPESGGEPAPTGAKVPEGAFAVGTFNLDWAFDAIPQKRPGKAKPNVATDDDTWEWKRDRIVEILVAERLDVVVLTELGGERELSDITSSITVKNGYDYQYAWVDSEDRFSGQQVAILSRFPISGERRFDVKVPLHVAAEVELPGGQEITVIAVHLKEGKFEGATKQRRSQASSIRRMAKRELKKRPVVIAGTVASKFLPGDDDYEESAAQVLTGQKGCTDSATETLAQLTTVQDGDPMDRIIVCNMELKGAEAAAEDKIVRGEKDGPKTPWPSVPVDSGTERDVSDHLLLWAEVAVPKKAG